MRAYCSGIKGKAVFIKVLCVGTWHIQVKRHGVIKWRVFKGYQISIFVVAASSDNGRVFKLAVLNRADKFAKGIVRISENFSTCASFLGVVVLKKVHFVLKVKFWRAKMLGQTWVRRVI